MSVAEVDFTYESVSGIRSTLDHFIVSSNLSSQVISYNVLHDGNNVSDHNVVCLSLELDITYNESVEKQFYPQPLWQHASDDDIIKYKKDLSGLLSDICVPNDVINCNNHLCCEHV